MPLSSLLVNINYYRKVLDRKLQDNSGFPQTVPSKAENGAFVDGLFVLCQEGYIPFQSIQACCVVWRDDSELGTPALQVAS